MDAEPQAAGIATGVGKMDANAAYPGQPPAPDPLHTFEAMMHEQLAEAEANIEQARATLRTYEPIADSCRSSIAVLKESMAARQPQVSSNF